MDAPVRQSSFLPTIKCSSCGEQIEISMMGEHVCGMATVAPKKSQPSPSPPPEPEPFDTFKPWNKAVHEKIGRVPPPPKVDTLVANRTYYRAGQLTPVSNSSGSISRSLSPLTPNGRSGPGRPDDYFAPKIANDYDSGAPQPRRPGGYGAVDGLDEQLYPSASPKQAPNLLQRMNTIAPGPFEMNRRPGARDGFPTRGGSADDGMRDLPPPSPYGERPRTASSNASFGAGQAPRMPRKNGYGGFGPPLRGQEPDFEPEPLSAQSRAGTFPRRSDAMDPPLRTPSAPGPRPDRMRRPSHDPEMAGGRLPVGPDQSRRPSMGPDTSRPPPPRKSIISRPQTRDGNAPEINLAAEFGIGNPYHNRNPSMTSSASASSRPSQPGSLPSTRPSYDSSPARSLRRPGRNASDSSNLDDKIADLQSSMEDLTPRDLPDAPPPPPPLDKSGSLRSLRSKPSIDQGRGRSRDPSDLPETGPSSNPYGSPQRRREPSRPASRGREALGGGSSGGASSRGICKACGDPISGKSISSADGRLTGRYHKACFVCTTCGDPFTSSTFYVHEDRPYCERDWHKANHSLCGTCDNGIEGQYLADETDRKYHPDCFRCADCGMVLRDGYFDVAGKQYCERDALRRNHQLQQPWGGGADSGRLGPGFGKGMGMMGPPGRSPTPSNGSAYGRVGGLPGGPRRGMPLAANGLPGGPKGPPGGPFGGASGGGLPGPSGANRPPGGRPGFGPPSSNRLGPGPRPRMEKRMTRLGMM